MPIDFEQQAVATSAVVNATVNLSSTTLSALNKRYDKIIEMLKVLGLTNNAIVTIMQEVNEITILEEQDIAIKDISLDNK